MRKQHKTMNVQEFKKNVNSMLASSAYTQEQKSAICDVLHTVLHDTGNYNGFNYLAWIHGGYAKWIQDGEPKDNTPYLGDEYNRYYY